MAIKITKSKKKAIQASCKTKKTANGCSTSNISANPQPIEGDEEVCPDCGKNPCEYTSVSGVCEACDYIKSAINSLSICAKDNEIIKDSIANLGVVLLDLSCENENYEEQMDESIDELAEVAEPVEDIPAL